MRPDPGATLDPFVIDTRKLHRQPGASLRTTIATVVPGDLRNDVLEVVPGAPLEVDLLLESVLDGILVTGAAELPLSGLCVRCLDPVQRSDRVSFRQFFTYPGVGVAEDVDPEDVVEMVGDLIDVAPAFRDAVVLALPLTPTCRPDCPGLCPECGYRMADDPTHRHERIDPRWSGLSQWQAAAEKESE